MRNSPPLRLYENVRQSGVDEWEFQATTLQFDARKTGEKKSPGVVLPQVFDWVKSDGWKGLVSAMSGVVVSHVQKWPRVGTHTGSLR